MSELIHRAGKVIEYRASKVAAAAQRFSYRVSSRGRANARALEALAGRYRGRRLFVLGNGPSLLQAPLAALSNEVTIGSNGVFLLARSIGFLPTFLTVEDVLVAEDRADQLNALSGVTKIFPFDLSYCLLQDRDTLYVKFIREYSGFPRFSSNLARAVYWGGTVSFMNLQLACYLGCREIVLVGFDHSYEVKDLVGDDTVVLSTRPDVNHFDPSYFGPGYRYHDPMVDRMEKAYITARDALRAAGVKVYNATHGGKLEVFPRRSLHDVLGLANEPVESTSVRT